MPTTALTLTVNATGYTNSSWTTPLNALVSNNTYASFAPGATSNRYFAYDTNAASVLPANAVIVGVEVTIQYRVSATTLGPTVVAGPGQSNIPASSAGAITGTTTKATYTFGGPTNKLNALDRSYLATLAVRISQTTAGTVTHFLDHATMTVYWETPATGPNLLFFGENF